MCFRRSTDKLVYMLKAIILDGKNALLTPAMKTEHKRMVMHHNLELYQKYYLDGVIHWIGADCAVNDEVGGCTTVTESSVFSPVPKEVLCARCYATSPWPLMHLTYHFGNPQESRRTIECAKGFCKLNALQGFKLITFSLYRGKKGCTCGSH